MKNLVQKYTHKWRDILMVATGVLVLASLVLISYSISQANKLAFQTKQLAIQNQELAQKNTEHINCIIKDLSVPRPPGANQKVIELLGKDCNIKFTP